MISGKFIKSSLLYTVGGAMPMASGLVLLPFYTNMLSISTYGVLMLYVVFSLFMQSVTSYALDAYLGVHYIDVQHDKNATRKMVGTVAGLLLAIGLGVLVIAWLIGGPLFNASFNREGNLSFWPWGFMSVATGFLNGFFKATTNLLVFRREDWRFLWFNFFNFMLTIGISLIGLFQYPGEIIGPMYGRLFSGIGIFLLSFIFILKEYGISFRFKELKGLHSFCFPYVVYLVLVWVVTNIDRYIINGEMGAGDVGLYDFAIRCTLLIALVQDGMVSAINPVVYMIWKDNGKNETTPESNRYFNVYAAAGIVFIAGFSLLIPLVIPFVVSDTEYYASFVFMGALASGFATRGLYHYFLLPILYLKKTKLLSVAFGLSAAIQVPLTLWLTNTYDLAGAVWANIIAKGLQAVFLYLVIRPYFKFSINPLKLIALPLMFIIACIFIWYASDKYEWTLYVLLLAGTCFSVFMVYKKEIIVTTEKFLKRRR